MSTLTIIRGLPGSGKSTLAHRLAVKHGTLVVEPDALLVRDGRYGYTPKKFDRARHECLFILNTAAALGADAIYADVLPSREEVVALCDFFRHWAPKSRGVKFRIITLKINSEQSIQRNRHAVRAADIIFFETSWEDFPGESVFHHIPTAEEVYNEG